MEPYWSEKALSFGQLEGFVFVVVSPSGWREFLRQPTGPQVEFSAILETTFGFCCCDSSFCHQGFWGTREAELPCPLFPPSPSMMSFSRPAGGFGERGRSRTWEQPPAELWGSSSCLHAWTPTHLSLYVSIHPSKRAGEPGRPVPSPPGGCPRQPGPSFGKAGSCLTIFSSFCFFFCSFESCWHLSGLFAAWEMAMAWPPGVGTCRVILEEIRGVLPFGWVTSLFLLIFSPLFFLAVSMQRAHPPPRWRNASSLRV